MMASFDDAAAEAEAARIPLGRWGTPADLTAAARFLAGDDAAWITGSTLTVDGGASAAAGTRRWMVRASGSRLNPVGHDVAVC